MTVGHKIDVPLNTEQDVEDLALDAAGSCVVALDMLGDSKNMLEIYFVSFPSSVQEKSSLH